MQSESNPNQSSSKENQDLTFNEEFFLNEFKLFEHDPLSDLSFDNPIFPNSSENMTDGMDSDHRDLHDIPKLFHPQTNCSTKRKSNTPRKIQKHPWKFPIHQTKILDRSFENHLTKSYSQTEIRHLADETKLSPKQVQTYFDNKKARSKKVFLALKKFNQ